MAQALYTNTMIGAETYWRGYPLLCVCLNLQATINILRLSLQTAVLSVFRGTELTELHNSIEVG